MPRDRRNPLPIWPVKLNTSSQALQERIHVFYGLLVHALQDGVVHDADRQQGTAVQHFRWRKRTNQNVSSPSSSSHLYDKGPSKRRRFVEGETHSGG